MGVKGLRYQDTTKIDNRINSKLSYQQCSGRQEKKFSRLLFVFVHRVYLEKRMLRSKPGPSPHLFFFDGLRRIHPIFNAKFLFQLMYM